MSITSIVLVKNNEKSIIACIKSLNFSDEVIVVDDYSADTTTKLATKYGALVYKRKLAGNYSAQRNFGLRKATSKWILFIDSDETVSRKLKIEILHVIKKDDFDGHYILRTDTMWGK